MIFHKENHIIKRLLIPDFRELHKDTGFLDFPNDPVVKNPPVITGDTGSVPGLGRSHMPRGNIAHEPQLWSPHSGAHRLQLLKAVYPEPMLCSEKPLQGEATAMRSLCTSLKSSPCSLQLEKAHAQE